MFHDIKRLRRRAGRQASLFFEVGANVGQTKPRPHGVICSMSRSGNVLDNAAMESFFSSLKTERTGRKTYRTRDEARADVFDYIERFYNHKTQTLKDRLYEPHGVREAGWISLTACHPNRVQAKRSIGLVGAERAALRLAETREAVSDRSIV